MAKTHQIRFRLGLRPDPAGELTAGFRGPTSKGGRGKRKGGKGEVRGGEEQVRGMKGGKRGLREMGGEKGRWNGREGSRGEGKRTSFQNICVRVTHVA